MMQQRKHRLHPWKNLLQPILLTAKTEKLCPQHKEKQTFPAEQTKQT